jgi:hypothetical protein
MEDVDHIHIYSSYLISLPHRSDVAQIAWPA